MANNQPGQQIEMVTLDAIPTLSTLYRKQMKNAVPPLRQSPDVVTDPKVGYEVRGQQVDRDHLANYCMATGFRLSDDTPLLYPYVLSFPLAIQVMSHEDFPFPALGAVHISNDITQHRPLRLGETFDLRVHATRLRPHRKGLLVDVCTTVTVEDEVVWEQVSTFLSLGARFSNGTPVNVVTRGEDTGRRLEVEASGAILDNQVALLRLDEAEVLRYAEASGDANPIHTSKVGAKLFGFPRTIAHGMLTLARVLACLEGKLPGAVKVRAEFHKPVLLPATLALYGKTAEAGRKPVQLQLAKAKDPAITHAVVQVSPVDAAEESAESTRAEV